MIPSTEAESRSQIHALALADWNLPELNEHDVEVSIQKIEELILRNPELLERSPRFAENSKAVIAKLKSLANDKSKRKLEELSKFINGAIYKIDGSITFDNFPLLLNTACQDRNNDSLAKCFNFLKSKSSSSSPHQKPSKWLKEHLIKFSNDPNIIKNLLLGSCLIRNDACRDVCLQYLQENFQLPLLIDLNTATLSICVELGNTDAFFRMINKDLISSFSCYFDKMFNHSKMIESRNKLISIIDSHPQELLNMIDSIYTGQLKITQDNYQIYLKQSDQYEFPRIKEKVEKWIIENLDFSSRSLEHYKIALAISDDFQANKLKGTVIAEVVRNVFEKNDHLKPLVPPICEMLHNYALYITDLNLSGSFNKAEVSSLTSEVGFHAIFQFLSNTNSLNLSHNHQLGDSALTAMLPFLRKLEILDLEWCGNITQIGFQSIGVLTSLTILNLTYCTNIQDSWIDSISTKLTNLKSLQLNRCFQLTDRSMSMAAHHLTNMQNLSVDHCKNLTDRSVISWVKHAPRLRELNLVNCRITNLGLQIIGRFGNRLHNLSLTLSSKVTPDEVVLMASNLTKLRSLRLKCPPHSLTTPNMGNMQRLAQINSVIELVHTPGSPQRTESPSKLEG